MLCKSLHITPLYHIKTLIAFPSCCSVKGSHHLCCFQKYVFLSLEGISCPCLTTVLFHFTFQIFSSKHSKQYTQNSFSSSQGQKFSNCSRHLIPSVSQAMYFLQDQTTITDKNMPRPRPSHPRCKAKQLLLRDIRPTPNSQNQNLLRKTDICSSRCIYCDIWKLALLVYSRQNQSQHPNSLTSPSSPQHSASYPASDYAKAVKSIESAHHLQRTHLSSIISICTFEGAEESEGLRVAHERCLSTVLDLLRQERALQRQMVVLQEKSEREARERQREIREWRERDYAYAYAYGDSKAHASQSPGESWGGSEVSCAT